MWSCGESSDAGLSRSEALKLTITSDDNDMIEHDFLKPDVMTFTPRSLA